MTLLGVILFIWVMLNGLLVAYIMCVYGLWHFNMSIGAMKIRDAIINYTIFLPCIMIMAIARFFDAIILNIIKNLSKNIK